MAAIAVVLILAANKPDICRVQRAATIKADAAKVFPYINDFHNWASWSPFEKLDRNMNKTFSGQASGKGAIFEWAG